MHDNFECPICKSHKWNIIGNDKFGYGLVKLDLKTKTVVEKPYPEFIAFNVYICSNCKHVEFKNIPLND